MDGRPHLNFIPRFIYHMSLSPGLVLMNMVPASMKSPDSWETETPIPEGSPKLIVMVEVIAPEWTERPEIQVALGIITMVDGLNNS